MSFGYHLSKDKTFFQTIKKAYEADDTSAYQIFLKSPQRRALAKIKKKDKEDTKKYVDQNGINLYVHSGYLFNIGDELKDYPISTGVDDIIQGSDLGIRGAVFHVGKHCKRCTEKECIERMIVYINTVINQTLNVPVKFLLETGAGCGTEVCRKLEDLKYIYDRVLHKEKFAFCIDTCHIFAAGFNIRDNPMEYITNFDNIIGLDKVELIHLNDSKGKLSSCVDRHQNLCLGEIKKDGLRTFVKFFYDINVPIVLETPSGDQRLNDLNYIREWIN